MTPTISRSSGPVRRGVLVDASVLLLIAVLSAHQLLVAPIVGLADNGDYTRVMNPLGLAHVGTSYEDRYFIWVQQHYKAGPRDMSDLVPSSELLLAAVARGLDLVFSRDGLFDLRVLGAVHLACYLAGVWLVLVAVRPLPGAARAVALAGVVLATPDVAYVSQLNSFYSEPASLVFLVILLGVALRCVSAEAPGRGAIVAYFVGAALFVDTKVQNYVLGVPLACLPVALLACRTWRRRWTLVVPLALGLLALSAYLFVRVPVSLTRPARWNALFYGILVDSPSPQADLAEFGLDPELARFVGTYGVEIDGVQVAAPFMEVAGRFGFSDIALFYLRHPDRLLAVASACAQRLFLWREPLLGNYTRDSGKPASARAPSYTGWTDLQKTIFPRQFWFLVVFFGLFAGVVAWEIRRGLDSPAARTALLGLTMATMAVIAFSVQVVAGGTEDAISHLFLFQVLFDVCLFFGLVWVAVRCGPFLPGAAARGAGGGRVTPAAR